MEKLFWVDLEMTGLDVQKEVIIEVAAVITDSQLKPLGQYHAVVKQPQEILDRMEPWPAKHHAENGLLALIPNGKDPAVVETELIQFIDQHFPSTERPILAGNSIHQDRLFINKYQQRLNTRLHYRMLDVTSWKIVMNSEFKIKYEKQNSHRAIDDVLESINELKFYLSHVK